MTCVVRLIHTNNRLAKFSERLFLAKNIFSYINNITLPYSNTKCTRPHQIQPCMNGLTVYSSCLNLLKQSRAL